MNSQTRSWGASAVVLPFLLAILACPAFDPEFGEIGVAEIRTVRDQIAQRGAINELRSGQLLPPVMRAHEVDCWVVLWDRENPDPLVRVLTVMGAEMGGKVALILCEGESRASTRVAFGRSFVDVGGVYELVDVPGDEALGGALLERLETLDPRTIAINRSPGKPYADGLSASNEAWLRDVLGERLSERMVSSGPFVEEWLSQHLEVEVALFTEAARLTVDLLEQVLSDVYIVAAGTSVADLRWAVRQRARDIGFEVAVPPMAYLQRSGAGIEGENLTGLDVLLQTGDLVFLTVGIEYLGYVTHYGRWVYMLHEEEDEAPGWVLAGLTEMADSLEATLPLLRSGSPADQIVVELEDSLGESDAIAVARAGFLVDQGFVSASISRIRPIALLYWDSSPVVQPGGMFALAVSRAWVEPAWGDAEVWISLLESAVVGPEGARLLVPPQRVPFLID